MVSLVIERENAMLDDLKHFNAQDYEDAFQLIRPESALWALVTLLAIVAIVERVPG
jgi:hypothetical protein